MQVFQQSNHQSQTTLKWQQISSNPKAHTIKKPGSALASVQKPAGKAGFFFFCLKESSSYFNRPLILLFLYCLLKKVQVGYAHANTRRGENLEAAVRTFWRGGRHEVSSMQRFNGLRKILQWGGWFFRLEMRRLRRNHRSSHSKKSLSAKLDGGWFSPPPERHSPRRPSLTGASFSLRISTDDRKGTPCLWLSTAAYLFNVTFPITVVQVIA